MNTFLTKFLLAFTCLCVASQLLVSPVLAGDLRTAKLARYLAYKGSPLVYAAPTFVAEADANGLDYRLVAAISGIESGFGRNYIAGTYNVWGWGVGKVPFVSFEHGIAVVSQGLRERYVSRGADEVEEIGRIYCPPCTEKWPSAVRQFMAEIESVNISDLTIETNDTSLGLALTL